MISTENGLGRIGFIGAGRMATALASGLCRELVEPNSVVASDVLESSRQQFEEQVGGTTHVDNAAVLDAADIVFLAVKPQVFPRVLNEIRPLVGDHHLLVSIAAGVTIAQIEEELERPVRLVRVMPNTPSLIGSGASAFSVGQHVVTGDADCVERMLNTVGISFELPESLLDAVTGLSGSGPAYVYQIIEALSDGGVCMGLPREVATQLAAQTLIGASRMVLETGEHPGALKDAVTSPGGTTIAALKSLENSGLRGALMNAVEAATVRSRTLGES